MSLRPSPSRSPIATASGAGARRVRDVGLEQRRRERAPLLRRLLVASLGRVAVFRRVATRDRDAEQRHLTSASLQDFAIAPPAA